MTEISDSGKKQALEKIQNLSSAFAITPSEVSEFLSQTKSPAHQNNNVETQSVILAHMGGAIAISGLLIFIFSLWSNFTPNTQIIVTLGGGLLSFIYAIYAAEKNPNAKATAPLIIISTILQTIGLFIIFWHTVPPATDVRYVILLTLSVLMLEYALAYSRLRLGSLMAFMLLLYLEWVIFFQSLLNISLNISLIVTGASFGMISYAIDKRGHRESASFFYFTSAIYVLIGANSLLWGTNFGVLMLVLSMSLILLGVIVRSAALQMCGILSFLIYLFVFSFQSFPKSPTWVALLVAMGIIMLTLSMFVLNRRKNKEPSENKIF